MHRKISRLLALIALATLVACVEPFPYQNEDGNWRYVKGPNGEHCLEHLNGNVSGIACDTINWSEE